MNASLRRTSATGDQQGWFKMTSTKYVGLALLVSALVAPPCFAQSKPIILGVGVRDCAAYSKVSGTTPGVTVQVADEAGLRLQLNYILGFLAAANAYEQREILHGAKASDVIHWFDNYCSVHPEDSLMRALDHYVDTEGGRK